jgi:ESS family glutamate:Na+ symporter
MISLDVLPSLLAACLVLLLGTVVTQRVALLARYSIPSPIVGGILFALPPRCCCAPRGKASRWQTQPDPTCC